MQVQRVDSLATLGTVTSLEWRFTGSPDAPEYLTQVEVCVQPLVAGEVAKVDIYVDKLANAIPGITLVIDHTHLNKVIWSGSLPMAAPYRIRADVRDLSTGSNVYMILMTLNKAER